MSDKQNPQEVEETNIEQGFSPFEEAVIEKDYRKASYQVDPSLLSRDIDEPVFTAPNIDLGEDPTQSMDEDDSQPKEKAKLNPEYDSLDAEEQRASAEFIVDFALDSYAGLKMYAGSYAEISKKKIEKFEEQGLDTNIAVPFDANGNLVAVRDLISDFNEQIRETFVTPNSWREQVRPVAIRVAMKRGVGMSDEQMLGFMVVTDIIKTGFSANSMRKTIEATLGDIAGYCRSLTQKETTDLKRATETGQVVDLSEVKEEIVAEKPTNKTTARTRPTNKRPKAPKREKRVIEPALPKDNNGFVNNPNNTSSIELPSEILEHMNNIPVFDEEVDSTDKEMDFEEFKKAEKSKRSKRKED